MVRRKLPPFAALIAFEAVARHASFTRAADELGLTQSAVSHRVRVLEEHFGVRLIERLNPGIELTRDGRALMPELIDALARLSNLSIHRGRAQPVRLGVSTAVEQWWLSARLPRFARDHPEIDVEIAPFDSASDAQRLDVDVRIIWIPVDDPATARDCLLFPIETVFPVAAPSLLPRGPLSHPFDMARLPLIQKGSDDPGAQGAEWRWPSWVGDQLGSHQATRAPVRYREIGGALAAASAGVGLALGRSLLVCDALLDRRLTRALGPEHDRVCSKRHAVRWRVEARDKRYPALAEWLVAEASASLASMRRLAAA